LDGHAIAAPRVLPMQVMRSRRLSSASKLPDTPGSRLRRVGPSDLVLRPKPIKCPPMVLWANHQTPRARPGLPPSLLTRPPPCTGSIVHDFILLVSPPCGPHLVPPSTGSLEPSRLVSPSPGGPSRLKTFRAHSSPATTRTRPQPTPAHGAKSQSNTRCQSLITEDRSSIDHRDAPGPQRRHSLESSKWRTRVGITRLASRLSRLRSPGIRPMEKVSSLPKPPLRGLYP
jgi:hypothetical protein